MPSVNESAKLQGEKNQEKDTKTLQRFPLPAGNIYPQLADSSHAILRLGSTKLSPTGTPSSLGAPPDGRKGRFTGLGLEILWENSSCGLGGPCSRKDCRDSHPPVPPSG